MVTRFLWMIPVLVVIFVYHVAGNNFFVFDDFVWLHRAKILGQDWTQMFRPDILYFDPLVYLLFLVDFTIAGLDPRWYHGVDLALHAGNALLVFRFAEVLSGDKKAGLYCSILFASSCAVADAVLWSSSRVDLLSTMFSLGSLILFLRYLRTNNRQYWLLSSVLFGCALAAKGTPIILPLFLIGLLVIEKKVGCNARALIPYVILVIVYFVLLKLASVEAVAHVASFRPNMHNLSLALSELLIPERWLATMNPVVAAILAAGLILFLGFLRFPAGSYTSVRRIGMIILFTSLLPVLVLNDFKLATSVDDTIALLSSPSHRIYLASVGFALVMGGFLRAGEMMVWGQRQASPVVVTLLLLAIIGFHANEVRERDRIWQFAGTAVRRGLDGLLAHKAQIVEDGLVGFYNFPGSRGFFTPMVKLYCDLQNVIALPISTSGRITDPDLLRRMDRSAFFVLGFDLKVYDLSGKFKKVLFLCNQAQVNHSLLCVNACGAATIQMEQAIQAVLENTAAE